MEPYMFVQWVREGLYRIGRVQRNICRIKTENPMGIDLYISR